MYVMNTPLILLLLHKSEVQLMMTSLSLLFVNALLLNSHQRYCEAVVTVTVMILLSVYVLETFTVVV